MAFSSSVAWGSRCATRRLVASISSIAAKPASTRSGKERVASAKEENISNPVAKSAYAETVAKLASAIKARVPSLPITRCSRILAGESKSKNEFMPYPMVFLILKSRSIVPTDSGLLRTRSRSSRSPAWISGALDFKRSSASLAPVSRTRPFGKTKIKDSIVRYEFCCVPQHIPLELFATTPPIVQAISLAGSGPSLRLCRANAPFTARIVAPGLTRTDFPSTPTEISRKFFRVSTKKPSAIAWPLRLVPPERKVTPTLRLVASLRISAISPEFSGV